MDAILDKQKGWRTPEERKKVKEGQHIVWNKLRAWYRNQGTRNILGKAGK